MREAKTGEPDPHCVHKPVATLNVLDSRIFLSTLNSQLSTGLWVVERPERAGSARLGEAPPSCGLRADLLPLSHFPQARVESCRISRPHRALGIPKR